MNKLMKKLIAIFLMSVFVLGIIIIPVNHDLHQGASHYYGGASCCHEHSDSHSITSERTVYQGGLHKKDDMHDSLACPVCQLANLSLGVPYVSVGTPISYRIVSDNHTVFSQSDYATPRLLPFSCGPPVLSV